MNYQNFRTGHDKPTIIKAEQYGTKISVELDHSDTELDELMDAFETIVIGLGYHSDSWKQWILDRADEYREEADIAKLEIESIKNREELDSWFEESDRYLATEEDEDEFDDYGMKIPEGRVTFEWSDEEDIEPLFDGDEWEANENLKAANERYKSEVKKMSNKKKSK